MMRASAENAWLLHFQHLACSISRTVGPCARAARPMRSPCRVVRLASPSPPRTASPAAQPVCLAPRGPAAPARMRAMTGATACGARQAAPGCDVGAGPQAASRRPSPRRPRPCLDPKPTLCRDSPGSRSCHRCTRPTASRRQTCSRTPRTGRRPPAGCAARAGPWAPARRPPIGRWTLDPADTRSGPASARARPADYCSADRSRPAGLAGRPAGPVRAAWCSP